uniref:Uncharacterized protein n=1 Tax=Anguilla anguilla TaxID=7936 RepID=A0A0E9XW20_ANGAN
MPNKQSSGVRNTRLPREKESKASAEEVTSDITQKKEKKR